MVSSVNPTSSQNIPAGGHLVLLQEQDSFGKVTQQQQYNNSNNNNNINNNIQ